MDEQMASYYSKKGKEVKLSISKHAVIQFFQRWKIAFPDQPLSFDEVIDKIIQWFSSTNQIQNLSRKEQIRIKHYGNGKDTLFFRTNDFTFVVQNACIVTIELSNKNKRQFN